MKYFRGISTWGVVSAVVWLGLVIAGFVVLTLHATTPGARADHPSDGTTAAFHPADELPGSDVWMLVFLHPRCTCSVASVEQVERILDSTDRPVNVRVVVQSIKVDDRAGGEATDSLSLLPALERGIERLCCRSIPASVEYDDGTIAVDYGAMTSGHLQIYAPPQASGRRHRLFSGGVTGVRGHVGPNASSDAAIAAIRGGHKVRDRPVFGCALRGAG